MRRPQFVLLGGALDERLPEELHVLSGERLGLEHFELRDLAEDAERWREFRRAHGAADCRLLQALSGEMNVVRLIFSYPGLSTYEPEETRNVADPEYARVAGGMPFVEGTLADELYREIERA